MSLTSQFPDSFPSLRLDFANSKRLDPRVTFTRASSARYYDGQTVAKAEENLLIRSQEFDTSSWPKTNAGVTANAETAPDGTLTAETMTAVSATLVRVVQTIAILALTPYALSISIKAGTSNFAWVTMRDGGGNNRYFGVVADLSTGTITQTYFGGSSVLTSSSIVSEGNGWYRVSIIGTLPNVTSGSTNAIIGITDAATGNAVDLVGNVTASTAISTSIYLWGAQLEQRSSVTAYTPTTTQPITNYIPVLMTAQAGVPRFDHNPTTAESLGLLIEEQRTNLVTYSEQFDDAAWTKENSSITANTIVAPDGTLTGDKFIGTTDNSTHGVFFPSVGSTAVHTWSAYLKAGEYTWGVLRIGGASTFFNLSNGTVGTNAAGNTALITPVGNGWYRCSVTRTLTGSGSKVIRLASADNVETFAGNGYSGIFIWGAQLEAGAFPTSYIPTVASQVTRSADAANMTGVNFSSWYNAAEGTLYADAASSQGTSSRIVTLHDNTINNQIWLTTVLLESFSGYVNGSFQWNMSIAAAAGRIAGAYQTNDIAASRNGGAVVTDNSALLPIVNRMTLGASWNGGVIINGTIRKIAYYPERLTNAQLQALTS